MLTGTEYDILRELVGLAFLLGFILIMLSWGSK